MSEYKGERKNTECRIVACCREGTRKGDDWKPIQIVSSRHLLKDWTLGQIQIQISIFWGMELELSLLVIKT